MHLYMHSKQVKNSYAFIHAFKTKKYQKMNFQIMVSWPSQDSSENFWRKNSKLYLQWRKNSKLYLHRNIWLNMLLQLERTQSCISTVVKVTQSQPFI